MVQSSFLNFPSLAACNDASIMQYPIDLRFKLFSLTNSIVAKDASGKELLFVRQQLLRLKEAVDVYSDSSRTKQLFHIRADRILDFTANYSFTATDGMAWGSVRRKGMRSLWQAHYEIIQDGQVDMVLREENPWKKILDGILGELPVVGILFVYFINPSYLVSRPDGTPLLRVTKRRSFLEASFRVDKLNEMPEDDELRSLLALLMLTILERARG
jgi:uncharacterized protein YxjI